MPDPDPHAPKGGNTRAPPAVPPVLAAALRAHTTARDTFAAFSSAQRLAYIQWIARADGEETHRRVAQAIAWLAQGRPLAPKHRAG